MKYIKDFLDNNQNSIIFSMLNCCTSREIKILQALTQRYIRGIDHIKSCDFLNEEFIQYDSLFKQDDILVEDNDNLNILQGLDELKNIIDLGFIESSFTSFAKKTHFSTLSLLQADIRLSDSFLLLLEGEIQPLTTQAVQYNNHSEYLKDQFARINLYSKRVNAHQKNKLNEYIANIENMIDTRLKLSKIYLPCEKIFKDNNFNKKEQIIFLALLKEEYCEGENLRELNELLSLISQDDLERIKNRSLFEEDSRLIQSGVVEYDEFSTPFAHISRNFYISEEILSQIMHSKKITKSYNKKIENIVKETEIFDLITPSTDLSDVVLSEQTRNLLENILKQFDKRVQNRLSSWGLKTRKQIDAKVLLFGPAGTGKTMSAICLAKSLKKQILSFDCSRILSKYVGESEQNVRKIFDSYKEICIKSKSEPVLLLNEADQFLSSRMDVTTSGAEKMHNQMQNIFLEQIEKFNGVLIATTNFMQGLDKAFSRRFDYKIEFKKPEFKERIQLWQKVLPKNATYEENFNIDKIANFKLSGASIALVMKNVALKTAISEDGIFYTDTFIEEIKREQKSSFEEDKKVGLL